MVESGKVGTHSGTQTSNLRDAFARQKTVAKAITAFEPASKGEASIHGQRTHRASGSIYGVPEPPLSRLSLTRSPRAGELALPPASASRGRGVHSRAPGRLA